MPKATTMEIHDYSQDGERIFFNTREKKSFVISITAANNTDEGAISNFFRGGIHFVRGNRKKVFKQTSRMNVAIRGSDGKFISYRTLQNEYTGVFNAVEGLPSV